VFSRFRGLRIRILATCAQTRTKPFQTGRFLAITPFPADP
jgi:hypothetical protein